MCSAVPEIGLLRPCKADSLDSGAQAIFNAGFQVTSGVISCWLSPQMSTMPPIIPNHPPSAQGAQKKRRYNCQKWLVRSSRCGGARPTAVGTTAQPYTAGRPAPPQLTSVLRRDLQSDLLREIHRERPGPAEMRQRRQGEPNGRDSCPSGAVTLRTAPLRARRCSR